MSVDGHYRVNEIVGRHFMNAAKAAGFGLGLAEEILDEVRRDIQSFADRALDELPPKFPEELANSIVLESINAHARSNACSLVKRVGRSLPQ